MSKKETTHEYLHRNGLDLLKREFESDNIDFTKLNCSEDKWNDFSLKLNEFDKYRDEFIDNASYPDQHENYVVFEWRNELRRMRRPKLFKVFPIGYTGHFFSPETVRSYVNMDNRVTNIFCNSSIDLIRNTGYELKKQGLGFNAFNLFRAHMKNAADKLQENNYIFNSEIICEFSKGLHYIEDMCESHHVTNKIGLPFAFILDFPLIRDTSISKKYNHSLFEKYANHVKEKHNLSSVSSFSKLKSLKAEEREFWSSFDYYFEFLNESILRNTNGSKAFVKICDFYATYCISFSSGICDFYESENNYSYRVELIESNERHLWTSNIEQTLGFAQLIVSIIIFNFILYSASPESFNFKD